MRYLPLTDDDRQAMLASIGVSSIDDLFVDVPNGALQTGLLDLPVHQSEMAVERAMAALANQNRSAGEGPFFLGAGAYRHHIPATVKHLMSRGEFLTAYTPYQPEISQGTLQVLFEFQSQVARLTGMEVANASMYDGSTACAEAVLMARRISKRKKVVVSGGLHPQYADVITTMTRYTDDDVDFQAPSTQSDDEALIAALDDQTSCVVVQNPDVFGNVRDLGALAGAVHAAGALLVTVVTETVSLGAIRSPGEMGADIVVGEGQSIGNALNFGGPYLGLFATRLRYVRQMPGRLCGETKDSDGQRGFVLTLSTREQHIRREKATSNICTNSGLCALAFSIHLSLLGETGLRQLAHVNHMRAVQLAEAMEQIDGVELLNDTFFNEFTIRVPGDARALVNRLAGQGILAGVSGGRLFNTETDLTDLIVMTATETTTDEDITALSVALQEALT
jgi:glycine dehydrogenase subunit 1